MNATPMNLNSAPSVQAQAQAGKQADAASADVPFSQVLSGEIAQARKTDNARQGGDTSPETEPAAKATGQAEAHAGSPASARPEKDGAHDRHATAAEDAAAAVPAALLALAINPDAFKAAAAGTASANDTAAATAPGTEALSLLDGRKGRAASSLPAGRSAGAPHAAQQADLASPAGKLDAAASARTAGVAPAAEAAPRFAERLATVLHADAPRPDGLPADLLGNPALRAAAPAPHAIQSAPVDPASTRLAPTVGTSAWSQALGEKVVWMAAGSQQSASLTLNPPNLGPLQIVLHVANDQATASFFSVQPEVRQALESAFPRLREMMNEAGIQLGQATVSADTPRQNDTPERQAQGAVPSFPGPDAPAVADVAAVHAPIRSAGRGLVDTFA